MYFIFFSISFIFVYFMYFMFSEFHTCCVLKPFHVFSVACLWCDWCILCIHLLLGDATKKEILFLNEWYIFLLFSDCSVLFTYCWRLPPRQRFLWMNVAYFSLIFRLLWSCVSVALCDRVAESGCEPFVHEVFVASRDIGLFLFVYSQGSCWWW